MKRPSEFYGPEKSAELVAALGEALDWRFSDAETALRALSHRSLCAAGAKLPDNERLEFLGDAVVNCLVVAELYRRYPDDSEGKLSALKSKLVGTGAFARCSAQLGLPALLQMSQSAERGGTRDRDNIREDVFEAAMGALFLDGGAEPVRRVLERVLFCRFEEWGGDAALENWKGDLNEWLQGRGKPAAEYREASRSGPDHELRFVMEALSEGEVLGRGEGRNKPEAERNAARDALSKLGRDAGRR